MLTPSAVVSIGIASNVLLARLATRHAKPAGSFHLRSEEAGSFLAKLDVGELPGFGWSTKKKVQAELGTTICGELLQYSKGKLQSILGEKTGETLYNFIRGVDDRRIEAHKERKSVSAEVNVSLHGLLWKSNEYIQADPLPGNSTASDSSPRKRPKSSWSIFRERLHDV